jgi:phytoene dehydrogenase-like protein
LVAKRTYDAVVIGSGPNGLAAAITLAREGLSVVVFEANETIGGGARTAELTLPGFLHDSCSAIHPMGVASPLFAELPLAQHGLEWIQPPAPVAHPLDDGTAVMLERSVAKTAEGLGPDGPAWSRLFSPLVAEWDNLKGELLGPLRFPKHPLAMARFGMQGLRPAASLARSRFRGERARALFAGLAAHAILPLEWMPTASVGLVFGLTAHAVGWPLPRGGSRMISDALAGYLRSLGGEIVAGSPVESLAQLPPSRAVLCDIGPRQLVKIAGPRLSESYRRKLLGYRYGPAAFKLDWALAGPIPWRAPECARAATVHLGGGFEEVLASERAPWQGIVSDRPFVLVTQPSLFDDSRAPGGKHTAWAYCHVPTGWNADVSPRIERQIERFAPGFGSLVLARSVMTPAELERYNANLVGGDIAGGAMTLGQLFARPTLRMYATPARGVYLCSASTPPGGGVHGMCGYFAARAALKDCFG